jgi:hypothetical protein
MRLEGLGKLKKKSTSSGLSITEVNLKYFKNGGLLMELLQIRLV